jgi:hypothetical protein
MDHFKGINETERYNNDLLNETRRTNVLLEQIAQLLQQKEVKGDKHETTNRPQSTRVHKRNT